MSYYELSTSSHFVLPGEEREEIINVGEEDQALLCDHPFILRDP